MTRPSPAALAAVAEGRTVYARHGDEWVLCGPDLHPGAEVSVTTRDGATRSAWVTDVIATGDAWVMARFTRSPVRESADDRLRAAHARLCAECQDRPGRIKRVDSSGIAGLVCSRCARLPAHQLSFA